MILIPMRLELPTNAVADHPRPSGHPRYNDYEPITELTDVLAGDHFALADQATYWGDTLIWPDVTWDVSGDTCDMVVDKVDGGWVYCHAAPGMKNRGELPEDQMTLVYKPNLKFPLMVLSVGLEET